MSTAQENAVEGLADLERDLNLAAETSIEQNSALDLNTLGKRHLEELSVHKTMRRDMIAKRAALKRAIQILDKRIEISLAAVKVLQTPT